MTGAGNRLGAGRRGLLAYGALLGLSFIGTWGYLTVAREGQRLNILDRAPAVAAARRATEAIAAAVGRTAETSGEAVDSPPEDKAPRLTVNGVELTDGQAKEYLQAVALSSEMSIEATSAVTAEERAAALDSLGEVSTPEVVQALRTALVTDADPENRIRAIDAMTRVGLRSRDAAEAVIVVQAATQDVDPAVAEHSRKMLLFLTEPQEEPFVN